MTRPLDTYTDIHSHSRLHELDGSTVVSITPGETMAPGGHYSVGIHPWATATGDVSPGMLRNLVAMARDPRVKAIGEAGYDSLRGGDPEVQDRLFRFQARLAARTGKPLIVHCVRAWDRLLRAAREMRPAPGMWIVHGFRGKAALARQLLDAGLSLSYGLRFNADALADTPPHRLYRETDTPAEPDIQEIH